MVNIHELLLYPRVNITIINYLVLDRESNRNERKTGLNQNISLFEENSELFDVDNGIFWSNPAFP